MITFKESTNSLKESANLAKSFCLSEIRNVLSLPGKRFEIAVSGKGNLMLYDDEAINCIKYTPFVFNYAKATLEIAKESSGEPCPILTFFVGKDIFRMSFKKDWIKVFVNQLPKYPGDWALYGESTEVVEFDHTHSKTLKGESNTLFTMLKVKHADDERSDDSQQPLPIFQHMTLNIKIL